MAGTAKLFSASTNVSTAASASSPLATGMQQPAQQREARHRRFTLKLRRFQSSPRASTANNVIGHSSSDRIQIVPPSE